MIMVMCIILQWKWRSPPPILASKLNDGDETSRLNPFPMPEAVPMKPKPLHVLITDDEPMLREVIAEFLDCLDFCTCAEAGNGAEALEYLEAHRVDCLLSDIKMPRMGLEEALPRITREYPETIVIATSGYSDLEVASKIFRLGAHEFLAKPLDLDLLEDALKWIARRNSILEMAESLFQTSNGDNGDWDRRLMSSVRRRPKAAAPMPRG